MKALLEWWPFLVAIFGAVGGAGYFARAAAARAWLRDFLARVQVERRTVALEVEQTYVDRLLRAREASSPGGAELTAEEQRAALDLAVHRFLELVGLDAIDRALRLLKLPRLPGFVHRWAVSHVEAGVKEISIEQAAANGAAPVPSDLVITRPLPPVPPPDLPR